MPSFFRIWAIALVTFIGGSSVLGGGLTASLRHRGGRGTPGRHGRGPRPSGPMLRAGRRGPIRLLEVGLGVLAGEQGGAGPAGPDPGGGLVRVAVAAPAHRRPVRYFDKLDLVLAHDQLAAGDEPLAAVVA